MQTVVETSVYLRKAEKLNISEEEREEVISFLAENPNAGDEISGTGGARKLRFAPSGRGKSGGYRIVTFYSGTDIPVFLMTVYGKGQKANLTPKERNALKSVLGRVVELYKGIKNV
ncbi:MAG: type II toxin-antitoxin system RelE/ParE family toxin [Halopseudomonas aestusnigri]